MRKVYPLSIWWFWAVGVPMALVAVGGVLAASTPADALIFDRADLWWLGLVAPACGLVIVYGAWRRHRALHAYTSAALASFLVPDLSANRRGIRGGMFVVATALVAAGLIGPRWGTYLEKQRVFGVDVIVALDTSRSMLATDVSPNRIEHAKRMIREQLVERSAFDGAHRLALVAFAGSTSTRLPLTTDLLAFRSKLEQIAVGMVPRGGTAIAQAIARSTDLFARSPKESTRVIIVFTDGEDHEGDAVAAAQTAWQEHGIRVYVVAVGDPSRTVGAQVPGSDPTGKRPLLHDGQIVFSKVDLDAARRIAIAGNGQGLVIGDLPRLIGGLASARKTELTTEERIRRKPQYQWFLLGALVLLYSEVWIGDARRRSDNRLRRVWQQEAMA